MLGFAGSFYAYEGLDLLLEALAMLAPRTSGSALAAGRRRPPGAGTESAGGRSAVSPIASCSPAAYRTREVQRYYDLIDVLVYPRQRMRLTELVTPLKPLEAMAQGRMLVASDVGGHRELIRDGETGFLFPAGDVAALAAAIDRVLARRDDVAAIRAQARRFVETERTWARSVASYERRLCALLRPRTRGTRLKASPEQLVAHVRHLRHPHPRRAAQPAARCGAMGRVTLHRGPG